jgi:hypothetical protein
MNNGMEEYCQKLTKTLYGFVLYQGLSPSDYTFKYVDDPGDWFIGTIDGKTVTINTNILNRCSYDYFTSIAIHELHHLIVGGLPNKSDAKSARAHYGDLGLRIIDIEADLAVFSYMVECQNAQHRDFLKVLHEGQLIFRDPKIIKGKFERWMGTILSSYHYSLNRITRIIVPNIDPMALDASVAVLVIDSIHRYAQLPFALEKFNDVKFLFQYGYTISAESFVDRCQAFAQTFLHVMNINPNLSESWK